MAAPDIIVKKATAYDAVRVARMVDEWISVSAIAWPPASQGPMMAWVLHVIENGYAVLAERGGRVFGIAAVQPAWMPWNLEQPVLRDAWFYVAPAFRKLGVADALMSALKLHAARENMPMICEIISGVETEKLEKYYSIRGGRYVGGVLVFGLPDKSAQVAA